MVHGKNEQDEVEKKENKRSCNVAENEGRKGREMNVKLELFHARLGLISSSKMQHISFCNCKYLKHYFCDTCCLAKHHKLSFMPSKSIVENIFDLIHIDL